MQVDIVDDIAEPDPVEDVAERAALGARSVAGDPQTAVVSRGTLVQTMLQLPQGDGQEAAVAVPN